MLKTYRLKEDARYDIPTEEAIKHKDLLINCDIALEEASNLAKLGSQLEEAITGVARNYESDLNGMLLFEGNFNAGLIQENGEEHQFIQKYYQHIKTWNSK